MSTYAIIKTGGKQYRVEPGQSLLVERLPVGDGESVALRPLLYVNGSDVVDGEGLGQVSVRARVVGHERGPKLRVVKFKPKRGYKRRTGHRQELTRIEVTALELSSGGSGLGASASPQPVAAGQESAGPTASPAVQESAGPTASPAVQESAGPTASPAVQESAGPTASPAAQGSAGDAPSPATEEAQNGA
jgi:large subunit ribosomal protein L21